MPLIEVFFSIIAPFQLVTLLRNVTSPWISSLRVLQNVLMVAYERIFYYSAIFQEKRIPRNMYVLSVSNDFYKILSTMLTVHAAFISSSLRVVGYG